MAAPLIGITTNQNQNEFGFPQFSLNQAYLSAFSGAGATPVMIPLGIDNDRVVQLCKRLDGIVFSGGGDIHPENYDSQMHAAVASVDTDRDRVELHLLQVALKYRLPVFGICRGLQLINVGMGGTLYEDILDQRQDSLQHQCFPQHPREYLAHRVELVTNSQLQTILDRSHIQVNSMHHQGINRLAPDLEATAHAPDGLVESIEIRSYPFGLAVQWHPEHLQTLAPMQSLFSAFVRACHNSKRG